MGDLSLTPQEKKVLQLLWKGLSTREIAKQLGRSYRTITWHRQGIRTKFGVRSTGAMLRTALERGILKTVEGTGK